MKKICTLETSMGCRKLTYQKAFPTLKVVYNDLIVKENSCVGGYRYGFNGMERDDQIKGAGNSYNYRMDDPRVGRFLSIDPLAYKFPYYSSYQFASNSVIMAIEMEGLETSFRVNYTEASITIKKDKYNRLSVSRKEFFSVPKGYKRMPASQSYSSEDPKPGGHVDIWVSNFYIVGAHKGEGRWMRINIPTSKTVIQERMRPVSHMVPLVTWEKKDVNVSYQPGDFYAVPTPILELKSKLEDKIGNVDSKDYKVSKVSVYGPQGMGEEVKDMITNRLKNTFGNKIKIEINTTGGWDSSISFSIGSVKEKKVKNKKVTKMETKKVKVPTIEKDKD